MTETTPLQQPRPDGKPGFRIVTPTRMGFVEKDGSDVRMERIRLYGPDGTLEKTYLIDPMGTPFQDLPDVKDDHEYRSKAKEKR